LPDIIQFKNGNQIKNTYDASGRKLGTEYFTQQLLIDPLSNGQILNQSYISGVVSQNGTVYIDDKEYNTTNGNPALTALTRVYNAEGYTENINSSIPNYYYYRRDHLGNNWEVWLANTNATVQYTQYYPSGLPWASNAGDNPGIQERKYNGKEFVEMHGYDTYDYGARGYYPAIGRFTSVDPLAEKYYSISPYAYCHNNPIRFIDPDGRGEKDKIEIKVPNLSDVFHATLASFGLDIQSPKGDTQSAAKESDEHNAQQAETRAEIKENVKQEARNTADNLETGGTAMQAGGYVLAPVTAGESLALVPIGKGVGMTGSIINGVLDLSEGKTGKVAASIASSYLFGKATTKIQNLEKVGKLDKVASGIYQFMIDVKEKISNACINFISNK